MMKPKNQLLVFIGTVVLLVAFIALSIVYGYTDTSWKAAFDTFMEPDGSTEHLVIQNIRLPRALIAAAVGASLAISGVLMQTLTKNPLASPGIFGINAGGGFMVVMAVTLFGVTSLQSFAWLSFLGAAIAAAGVFIIGGASGSNGLTPMKLTLAGAAITAMFSSFTQGLLVLNESALEQVLFWLAGSVQGRSLEILAGVFPYILAGWILALMIAGKVNILAMGEDVAKGLGVKTNILKVISLVAVVLLAGGSVAVAGPIGFIGIVIPHIARKMIGVDHRWLIPYSGLLGAILLLAADIGARYIIMPQEVPVGVMTAVIGAPFFVYVARRGY
ncbi:iron ABC transporter permease [Rossellomorea sp. RS05]|uniref:FecCD family ABC transporter permease n=1 Tax=Rossellomorea sp. RS05 TaxID=3149166 RepID=UPI0032216BD4